MENMKEGLKDMKDKTRLNMSNQTRSNEWRKQEKASIEKDNGQEFS